MQNWAIKYMCGWGLACLITLALMIRKRSTVELLHRGYWRYLLQGWKITSFIIAMTGLTVVAPYTGDPTWDYADSIFMSILTFITAPWVFGTVYTDNIGYRLYRVHG